jgi:thiol-disulfide isomerase/thioredoxin
MKSAGRDLTILAAMFLLLALPARGGDNNPIKFPDLDLTGIDGSAVRLSQLRGNVVVLNFWATWCGPCRMELPQLQNLYNHWSDRNLVILAVNVDEDRTRVAPFLKNRNLSLPVYYAQPQDAAALTFQGIPSTYIVRPDGDLERAFVGYDPSAETLWKQHIEKFLRTRKK